MIDHLLRDFQMLRKADLVIGKIWLGFFARRLGLFAFAGLIAIFGLGMGNLAAYNALQSLIGVIWSAIAVAAADFAIAAVVLLVARNSRPGPEIDMAFEMRRVAIELMQEDARELKLAADAVTHEMKTVKESIASVVHNPLDAMAEKLLVPALLSIMHGLRTKKEHA
jgi:hypothetical protein